MTNEKDTPLTQQSELNTPPENGENRTNEKVSQDTAKTTRLDINETVNKDNNNIEGDEENEDETDYTDIEALLRETDQIMEEETTTDKLIKRYTLKKKVLEEKKNFPNKIEQAITKREEDVDKKYNYELYDFDTLEKEGIITTKECNIYKKIKEKIDQANEKLKENFTNKLKQQIEKLEKVFDQFTSNIEDKIKEKKISELEPYKDKAEKVLKHNEKLIQKLEQSISELENNPLVKAKLEDIKNELQKEEIQKRMQLIIELQKNIQSINSKQKNAIDKLGEIIGKEDLYNQLLTINEEGKNPTKRINTIRRAIIKKILLDEFKSPEQIVPWIKRTSIKYFDALNYLRHQKSNGNIDELLKTDISENIKSQLKEIDNILGLHGTLYKLFGFKNKNSKKPASPFWQAFEDKKKNDKTGKTKELIKQQKEKEEAYKREQKIKQELIKQGGFEVKIPFNKKCKIASSEKQMKSYRKGVIIIEEFRTKAGNKNYKITNFSKEFKGIISKNAVSQMDMSGFPWWLREPTKNHFDSLKDKKDQDKIPA